MLYRNNGEWVVCPFKVKYIQNGEELEAYTHDKQWWLDFEEKWDNTRIIEFENIQYTIEQLQRYEAIRHIGDGFGEQCSNYVKDGVFPEGINHPLRAIQIEAENKKMQKLIDTLIISSL